MAKKKLRIAMDLDGVIHRYNSGWCGHDVLPDLPVQGVLEWMRVQLDYGHKIVLFSMRNAANDYLLNLDFIIQQYKDEIDSDRKPFPIQPVDVDVASIAQAQDAIINWLRLHGMEQHYLDALLFSLGKPHFDVYIDDRGFRFNTVTELPDLVDREFCKPWWKK